MANEGIHSEPTGAYDHNQAGMAEKVVDLIKTMALAWIKARGLDEDKFIIYAIAHIVLRFNPDECDRVRVSLDTRIEKVSERINYYLDAPLGDATCPIPILEYHYYHTKCAAHIDYAKSNSDAVRVDRVV